MIKAIRIKVDDTWHRMSGVVLGTKSWIVMPQLRLLSTVGFQV